jgi:hypothetical protein
VVIGKNLIINFHIKPLFDYIPNNFVSPSRLKPEKDVVITIKGNCDYSLTVEE